MCLEKKRRVKDIFVPWRLVWDSQQHTVKRMVPCHVGTCQAHKVYIRFAPLPATARPLFGRSRYLRKKEVGR